MRDRRVRGTSSTEGRASEHREPGKTTLTQQLQRRTVAAPKVGAESLVSGLAGGMGTPQPAGTGTQLERGTGADPSGTGPTARNPADAAKLAKTGTRIELPYRADLEVQLHRDLSNVEVYIGHVPGDLGVSSPGSAEEHEATAAETGTIEGAHAAPTAPAHAATKPMLALKPSKDSFCKTTATSELVATKGGSSQGKLPAGSLVQVTALDGTGYDVVVKSAGSWAGKTGYLPDGALVEAQGIIGNQVFNEGRLGGELDGTDTKINCLGHASGQKRAAYITNGTTEDMLKGLGFTCIVGDSTVLAPYIKKGKYAMMVYMYMYKPSWRSHDDQGLPFSGLAAKYGWTTDSWKQPNVYFGPNGEDRPIDYHALDYNAKTKKWEWVAQNREREGVGRCSWRRRAAAAVPPGTRSPRPSDPRAYCRAQVTGRAPVTGRVVISRSRFEGATGLSRPR